ncbi:CLC_0170 family protein [Hathewaya histolytica]|uniref:Uncharacterized protein n=1 Tax=Hathewaya histolytica TaxID=1498 RepID=A0A4U9RRM3_HATHI|nr:CLC_0170 family protein [Hathewaya histolytica]VTQ94246.1 Uncharacterised protein [Hathewaya histolytica]
MEYFELFDKYFFILVLIDGLILTQIDVRTFKKIKDHTAEKRARILGYSLIIIGFILFLIRELA